MNHSFHRIAVLCTTATAAAACIVLAAKPAQAQTLTLSPATVTIEVGDAVLVNATSTDVLDLTFTWASDDPTVAEVSGLGVVTGLAEGTATITATASRSDASGSAVVTVVAQPVSIIRADDSPTSASEVGFYVIFSESVTGVDESDFALAVFGLSGVSITNISGGGSTYAVVVNTGTGNGTVRLILIDDDSIANLSGQPLGGPGVGNGGFRDGEEYIVRHEAVTVYVDGSVLVSGIGTNGRPFKTISEALIQVAGSPGSAVIVRPGVGFYSEHLTIPPGIRLIGEAGAQKTRITGGVLSQDVLILNDDCVVRGFNVGDAGTEAAIRVLASAAVKVSNCGLHSSGTGLLAEAGAQVVFNNNTVGNNTNYGVRGEAGATFSLLKNSIFVGNIVAISTDSDAILDGGYNLLNSNGVDFDGPAPLPNTITAVAGFVDAGASNFHLTQDSPARDAGDPGVFFQDLDGTRNDLGADGGPFGVQDLRRPLAVIQAMPQAGESPLTVAFDASASMDEWGIASYVWDFDDLDGLAVDNTGPVVSNTYTKASRYTVTLLVTDNSGQRSWVRTPILVWEPDNTPPSVTIESAIPRAGPAPLTVVFTGDAQDPDGDTLTYFWEFGDETTSTEQNPEHVYPAGTPAGSILVRLTVIDGGNAAARARTFITITEEVEDIAQVLDPDADNVVEITDPLAVLAGASVTVPLGAVDDALVVTVGRTAAILPRFDEDFGEPVEFGPTGAVFAQPVTVFMPHRPDTSHSDVLEVFWFDPETRRWMTNGIGNVRHIEGSFAHFVEFDTTHFTAFGTKSIVPRTIVGAVMEADSAAPLAGATVTIIEKGLSTTSNADGLYTFAQELPQGIYTVEAKATGFVDESESHTVTSSSISKLNFELARVAAGNEGEGEGEGQNEGEGDGQSEGEGEIQSEGQNEGESGTNGCAGALMQQPKGNGYITFGRPLDSAPAGPLPDDLILMGVVMACLLWTGRKRRRPNASGFDR